MTNEEVLKVVLDDRQQAKNAKKEIDDKIDNWLQEFEGQPYGKEQDGRSKIVVKDIKKAVEWFVPTASDPFVKKNRIVELEGITADDVKRATMHERLLNHQAMRKNDWYTFITSQFKVSATEGTVHLRCGWNLIEDEKSEVFENIQAEQLAMFEEQGLEISKMEDNGDGTYNVTAISRKTVKNHPTVQVVRNGNCYPDPTAQDVDDCNFFIYKYETTISELKQQGKYDIEDIDSLKLESEESQLEQSRNTKLKEYGRDEHYESKAKANKKITVWEYWGNLDINDDGIAEPVFATVVNDQLLEVVDNPYPDKEIPFVKIPFSDIPFGYWGDSLGEFLSDGQKVRTSLMRGFIDNVAQANNGKKFAKKGAFDPINKKKYMNNSTGIIEVNGDKGDMWEGTFNQINPSVYNLYELLQQENESLSGINRTMQGVDSRGLNDSATGASIQQSNSQRRMMDIIRRHSNGIKKVFRKWISYNKEFLTDKEVMRITGEYIEFTRDDIDGDFDIDINVGTDGVAEAKVNQMTMLMQQVGGLSGVASIPPEFFNMMLSKMADEWGFVDIAQMLEKPQPKEPNPQQEAMVKADLDNKNMDTELKKAKAIQAMSDSNSKNVNTKMNAYGIDNKVQ